MMTRQFLLATLAYLVPTFALGFTWHFNFFPHIYDSLGIYNRAEPIIPLGFASMVIQGLLLAYLYPFYYRGGHPVWRGIQFGLLMGLFLYSVSTLANGAKIQVSPMSTWLLIQAAFHIIQFLVAGALIGLAYGRTPGRAAQPSS